MATALAIILYSIVCIALTDLRVLLADNNSETEINIITFKFKTMSTAKTQPQVAQVNNMTTKRFVIRKSLIGKSTVISFVNKKGDNCVYDHDKVYNQLKSKFDDMPCFQKYGSYTNSNNLPAFVRALPEII